MKKLSTVLGILMAIALMVGIASGATANWRKETNIIGQVLYYIENNYLFDVNLTDCRNDMLSGLTGREGSEEKSGCLDKYSGFMTAEEVQEMETELQGYFGGIGVSLEQKEKRVVVFKVIDGGPAKSVGFKSGDIIVKVRQDGEEEAIHVKNIYDAVKKLRGPIGTKVFVIIQRDDKEIELPAITRNKIKIQEVTHKIVKDDIGYIKIRGFSTAIVADDFETALVDLGNKKISKLIIDLRNNPGGKFYSALEMLYYFSANPEDIMVSVRYKNYTEVRTIGDPKGDFVYSGIEKKKSPGEHKHFKVAVLVNKHSSSASEIFAGVMKDWGSLNNQFVVIGEKTSGKGIGQSMIRLPQNTMLRLTTFEFLVGNSKIKIHKIGVVPNLIVHNTMKSHDDILTKKDRQFQEALKFLRNNQELSKFLKSNRE